MKTKIKTAFCILTAALLIISLAACNPAEIPSETSAPPSDSTADVTTTLAETTREPDYDHWVPTLYSYDSIEELKEGLAFVRQELQSLPPDAEFFEYQCAWAFPPDASAFVENCLSVALPTVDRGSSYINYDVERQILRINVVTNGISYLFDYYFSFDPDRVYTYDAPPVREDVRFGDTTVDIYREGNFFTVRDSQDAARIVLFVRDTVNVDRINLEQFEFVNITLD